MQERSSSCTWGCRDWLEVRGSALRRWALTRCVLVDVGFVKEETWTLAHLESKPACSHMGLTRQVQQVITQSYSMEDISSRVLLQTEKR